MLKVVRILEPQFLRSLLGPGIFDYDYNSDDICNAAAKEVGASAQANTVRNSHQWVN